ncbi:hypothetical protein C5167_049847 [Papaver somniferum]|uniref:C2 domain-containing protein n=1 Tax=Papaver somniferum TaxID=3469 RepID=A0A4Y7KLY2_PAPSO|nr:synaptotagmin-4-like [Papaver somniferum]RZC74364.1 hypothetical protein C5167_049847 [Papaver somniferum]
MGLVFGFIMGTLIGIALIAGWCHFMQYRSSKRISKAVDIKLLSSLGREDLRKICGDTFPAWISFPAFDQVKWMNKLLGKIWPYVAEAATLVIRESVEPLLEEYRPPGITSLKFSKLTLGNVAPKIEGIRVQSLKKGQITMDIDFRWGGDPNIILAVEAALVASIPIQFKDLQIFTVIRVIFQLSEEIPCISAFVVALLAEPKPRIDYTLKAVGGSLTALPGISDMIDDTVNSIITDMLQWPHRIVVPLGGVDVDVSELELKPQGKLSVTVIKANDLKNAEMIGKSDPYAAIFIRPIFRYKTKTIDNNLNPVWNQAFELIAEDKETQSLIIEVFDEDVGQDQRLGIAKLPLVDLEPETSKEISVRLLPALDMLKIKDKKDRGTITLKIFYHEFNKEEQLAALEEEKKTLEDRKKLKDQGIMGSTMDAIDGTASLVGSGIGMVGSGVGAGVGMVGSGVGAGVGMVGSGIGAGAGLVGSGIGAGAGAVGSGIGAGAGFVASGIGAVGSGFSKAGKFVGKSIIPGQSSASKRVTGSNIQQVPSTTTTPEQEGPKQA